MAVALIVSAGLARAVDAHPVVGPDVGLYRTFEATVANTNTTVGNRFADVWLNATFTSPAGEHTDFFGFFDGGDIWRLRFMPSAVGRWSYAWRFSDASLSGAGSFACVAAGASPGVLRPYKANPHWFSYNGDTPVFIKSYYNKAGGSQRQSASWFDQHFYAKLAARGVNHHMASGFLPVLPLTALWDGNVFADGPPAIADTLYANASSPETSMNLDVWHSLEGHMRVLNKYNISVQFFQGFNAQGPAAGPLQWSALPEPTKRWWVAYVVARLAPFANLGGYQYAWESAGNDTRTAAVDPEDCGQGSRCGDYQLAKLLKDTDVFQHMVTYEEENATTKNHFDLPAWDFAAVEALGEGDARLCGGVYQQNISCNVSGVQNHHDVSLQGYRGKPVYMSEGHNLWRSWWLAREQNVVRSAWAVTTAGASFTWSDLGHAPDDPYASNQTYATYPAAAHALDVHHLIMTREVPAFYRLEPADELLLPPAPSLTFCLAERGEQYVVYSDSGTEFFLDLTDGIKTNSTFSLAWFDAATGHKVPGGSVAAGAPKLSPPREGMHWVALLLRTAAANSIV